MIQGTVTMWFQWPATELSLRCRDWGRQRGAVHRFCLLPLIHREPSLSAEKFRARLLEIPERQFLLIKPQRSGIFLGLWLSEGFLKNVNLVGEALLWKKEGGRGSSGLRRSCSGSEQWSLSLWSTLAEIHISLVKQVCLRALAGHRPRGAALSPRSFWSICPLREFPEEISSAFWKSIDMHNSVNIFMATELYSWKLLKQ